MHLLYEVCTGTHEKYPTHHTGKHCHGSLVDTRKMLGTNEGITHQHQNDNCYIHVLFIVFFITNLGIYFQTEKEYLVLFI